jgi:ribosomal protein S18 acetylase RimI-like enzyme
MGDFTIRVAGDNDAENIELLIQQWWRIEKRRDRVDVIRQALRERGHEILVAESKSKIIGVLHLVVHPDVLFGDQYCHIAFLLVDEDHRRQGVASMLIENAIERAKARGAAEIHVDTTDREAEQLYRERGFKDDGVMLCLGLP